jgi:hypothetical protein
VADYSVGDLSGAAQSAGFSGAALVTAVAVALAENTGRILKAVNTNSDGSRDRGPWQINDKAHPDISDGCAFSLDCSAGAAFDISSQGRSWTPWTTWTNGAYKRYLADAQGAAGATTDSTGGSSDLLGVGSAIQGVTTQIVSAAQVAGGAVLILVGLVVAVVLVRRG